MAVTFQNTLAFATADESTAQNSANFTAGGTNRLLLVYVGATTNSDASVVSFDGAAFTIVASATRLTETITAWRLVNPSAGTGALIVERKASAGANFYNSVIVAGYTSVDQTTPIAEANIANAVLASMSALSSVSADWRAAPILAKTTAGFSSAQDMTVRNNAGETDSVMQLAETSASSGTITVRWVQGTGSWTLISPVIRHFAAADGGITVSPGATDILIAPQAANIAAGKALAPGASDILVAIQAPNIAAGKTVAPGELNIIVAAQEPTISIPVIVAPGETPIIVAPQAPVIAAGKVLEPGATDVVVAPQDASPAAGKTVAPGETNIIVAPQDPLIIAGSPIIQPDAADILINGQAPTIAAGKTVAPGETDILLEVQNADVVVTAAAAVSSRLFSVYRGKGLRHTEGVRDFEKTTGDQFVSDESE